MPEGFSTRQSEPRHHDFYFIYSERDLPLVREVQARLEARNISVCCADEKFSLSDQALAAALEGSIEHSDRIIWFLTPNLLKSPMPDVMRLEQKLTHGLHAEHFWIDVERQYAKNLAEWEFALENAHYLSSNDLAQRLIEKFSQATMPSLSEPRSLPDDIKYHFFLSYAYEDLPEVQRVRDELSRRGYSAFQHSDKIRAGDSISTVIEQAIKQSQVIVFFLSRASVLKDKSEWMIWEHARSENSHNCVYVCVNINLHDIQSSSYWAFCLRRPHLRLEDTNFYSQLEATLGEVVGAADHQHTRPTDFAPIRATFQSLLHQLSPTWLSKIGLGPKDQQPREHNGLDWSAMRAACVLLLILAPAASATPKVVRDHSHLDLRRALDSNDGEVARAIGYVLGTRDIRGGTTLLYSLRPVEGKVYLGTFSIGSNRLKAAGRAAKPEAADKFWLEILESQRTEYEGKALQSGLDPTDIRLALNYFDLYTQDPVAAAAWLSSSVDLKTPEGIGGSRAKVLDDKAEAVKTEQVQRSQAIEEFISYRRFHSQ